MVSFKMMSQVSKTFYSWIEAAVSDASFNYIVSLKITQFEIKRKEEKLRKPLNDNTSK